MSAGSASTIATASIKNPSLDYFRGLDEREKYAHVISLLQLVEVHQLRSLYNQIREMLSFDIVSQLPVEVSVMIMSYLDVTSLCAAAQCCHSWRNIANRDNLWIKLCMRKRYDRLSDLKRPPWAADTPTSPHPSLPSLPTTSPVTSGNGLPPVCHWWQVYIKAHTLNRNWAVGVYTVAPLLRGHRQRVTCIAHEDDQLVSGSCDGSVKVWSMDTLKCVHTLESHTADINCIVAKDGLIATGCADGLVRVFDATTGQCINSLHGHSGSVEHIALCGRTLVSAGSDCSVRVWDVHNGKLQHTLIGHTEEIECLQVCGDIALTGSWDHSLRVWDTAGGICKHTLLGHSEVVMSCCEGVWEGEGGRGGRVVSGGGDGLVKLWDIQDGREILSMAGHSAEVVCVKCDLHVVVSSSADSTIRVWDYTGHCRSILEGHIGVVRCLCLHGDRLVSGGDRKRVVVWDIKRGVQLHTVHRQQSLLHRMCVTDTKIITASPDSPGTISIISYW